jgi:hypothetical protein
MNYKKIHYGTLDEEEREIIHDALWNSASLLSYEAQDAFSFEEVNDLCEKWLEAFGFKFDEEKDTWIDLENDNAEKGEDPMSVVIEGGYQRDFERWLFDDYEESRDTLLYVLEKEKEERKMQKMLEDEEANLTANEA